MARIWIAGCGYVGTALAEELAADGHAVTGIRRRAEELPAAIEGVSADLTDPAALAALPARVDAVVYAAAASGRGVEAYRDAYVRGLRGVLAALRRRGATGARLLFTSSTGVYGQDRGEEVDETSAAEPRSETGRVLLEAEELVRTSGHPATVVRFGGIYGPGRDRLVRGVRDGSTPPAEAPARWTNRIHRDDCAGFLRHLLALERPEPLYLGVDDEPALLGDVLAWIARAPGGDGGAPAAGAPEEASGKRCRNRRLRASGYALRYPTYREGYAALA